MRVQQKQLDEMSDDQLTLEEKKRKGLKIGYSIIIAIMIGASIYGTLKNGFTFFTIMPAIFIPFFIIIWKSHHDARKEILARKKK